MTVKDGAKQKRSPKGQNGWEILYGMQEKENGEMKKDNRRKERKEAGIYTWPRGSESQKDKCVKEE